MAAVLLPAGQRHLLPSQGTVTPSGMQRVAMRSELGGPYVYIYIQIYILKYIYTHIHVRQIHVFYIDGGA